MRLLLVEPDVPTRDALVESLILAGYDLTPCSSTYEALDAYQAAPFAIVVHPASLPDGRGLALCRQIRQHQSGQMTTIVVTTTHDDAAMLEQIVDAGADEFIALPVDPDALLARLMLAIRRPRKETLERHDGEARIQGILEAAPEGIIALDPSGLIVIANTQAERLFGYEVGTLTGRCIDELVPGLFRGQRSAILHAFTEVGRACDGAAMTGYRRDGTTFPAEVRLGRSTPDDRSITITSIREVVDDRRTEAALRASEQRLRLALAAAGMGTWDWDLTSGQIAWSVESERLAGVAEGTGLHTIETFYRILHPDDLEHVRGEIQRILESGTDYAASYRLIMPNGAIRWVEAFGRLERDADGHPLHLRGVVMDVTARRSAEEALQDAHAELGRIISSVSDCLYSAEMLPDGSFTYRYFSPVAQRTLGRPASYFLSGGPQRWFEIVLPEDHIVVERAIEQVVTGKLPEFVTVVRIVLPGGSIRWIQDSVMITHRDDGTYWLDGVLTDITERRTFEAELAHRALHDALTGLPNRPLFLDRLAHALARRQTPDRYNAVLFLDLDNFKTVNDGLGHEAGDELLRAVAARLGKRLRAADTLARFGGDEFVILLEDLSSPEDAPRIAEELITGFAVPIPVQGREVYVGVSIGIALAGPHDTEPSVVLRNADAALYRAKSTGRNRSVLFDPDMTEAALARLELEANLRRALEDGTGLLLHYQPVFDLQTRQLSGCEALVRWAHPDGSILLPDAFIPLAEETGLIVPLGRWVLTEACRQRRRWQDDFGIADLIVSVNLSSRHFRERRLVQQVRDVLASTGLSPKHLMLEVTEHVLVNDEARDTIAALKGLGIGLAIDDFGTGYSSLNYLSAIEADVLKIDRRFVAGLTTEGREAAIVRAVLALGESLGMTVTAEGVETVEQMRTLRRLGCHRVQGFLLGRPVPPETLAGLIASLPPSRRTSPSGDVRGLADTSSSETVAHSLPIGT